VKNCPLKSPYRFIDVSLDGTVQHIEVNSKRKVIAVVANMYVMEVFSM
jgi:hypothetical protein